MPELKKNLSLSFKEEENGHFAVWAFLEVLTSEYSCPQGNTELYHAVFVPWATMPHPFASPFSPPTPLLKIDEGCLDFDSPQDVNYMFQNQVFC